MSSHEQPITLRLFVALPIPEPVKAAASGLQAGLRRLAPGHGVRWVRTEQFHLTLKFLGNVASPKLEALISATRQACQGQAAFRVRAEQVGFFPDERRPRVLWLGIQSETSGLAALQERIERATADFVEQQETRGFNPHLTLARIRSIRPAEARALAEHVGSLIHLALGEWTADQVEIIRSELHPDGSHYTCQAQIPFAAQV